MITEKDIQEQCKHLQKDVKDILDGIDDDNHLTHLICETITERMNILIEKVKS